MNKNYIMIIIIMALLTVAPMITMPSHAFSKPSGKKPISRDEYLAKCSAIAAKAESKHEALLRQKENVLNKYLKCWENCPGSVCSGSECRCTGTASCNQCGRVCNERFTAPIDDINKQIEEQARLIEYDQSEYYDTKVTFFEEYYPAFSACFSGVRYNDEGKEERIYANGTYETLDECLNAAGWTRPNAKKK